MNVSKIFGWLYGSSCLMFCWGEFEQMWNVFCPKKSIYYIVGAPKVLGLKRFWGVELIALATLF